MHLEVTSFFKVFRNVIKQSDASNNIKDVFCSFIILRVDSKDFKASQLHIQNTENEL